MKYTDILNPDGSLPFWWHWTNFTPKEVSCKHCGEIWQGDSKTPPAWFFEAMDCLQFLRKLWGKAIVVNSAHRCKAHNAAVGGVANSQHLTHIAFDCAIPKAYQSQFADLARKAGFKFVKLYPDRGFVHVDCRIGK